MSKINPNSLNNINEDNEINSKLNLYSNTHSFINTIQFKSKYNNCFTDEKNYLKRNKSQDFQQILSNIKTNFLYEFSLISDNKTINIENYDVHFDSNDEINNIKESRFTFNSLMMSNELGNDSLPRNNLKNINQTERNLFSNRYNNQLNNQLIDSIEIGQNNIILLSKNKLYSLYNKKNSLFYLLTFLDCEELKSFLNLNKRIRLLINTTLRNIYYPIIKRNIKNDNIEVLKSKIHYEKVKKGIKIDIITNIRFISKEENFLPKNISLIYIYKNFKSNIYSKDFLMDYYTYDFFPENSSYFPSIYMLREFSSFNSDILQKTYIQPILPFKTFDQGLLNLNIFSSENLFIDPKNISIKIINNSLFDKKNFKGLNPRICEYEEICVHWKNIYYLNNKQDEEFINKIKEIFTPYFKIINIIYDEIGFSVFKFIIKAIKNGLIKNKDEIGIDLLIKKEDDYIINEIKKNDLLFEKRNVFELRIGDVIVFYFKR